MFHFPYKEACLIEYGFSLSGPQDNYERIVKRAKDLFYVLVEFYDVLMEIIWGMPDNIIMNILQLVALILIMGEY